MPPTWPVKVSCDQVATGPANPEAAAAVPRTKKSVRYQGHGRPLEYWITAAQTYITSAATEGTSRTTSIGHSPAEVEPW